MAKTNTLHLHRHEFQTRKLQCLFQYFEGSQLAVLLFNIKKTHIHKTFTSFPTYPKILFFSVREVKKELIKTANCVFTFGSSWMLRHFSISFVGLHTKKRSEKVWTELFFRFGFSAQQMNAFLSYCCFTSFSTYWLWYVYVYAHKLTFEIIFFFLGYFIIL